MPILQQEASLIEDAQAIIANGQADPEILKRDLLDLADRRERAWNRGFTRRAIQRSQRNRMQTMRWSQVSMIFQGAMNASPGVPSRRPDRGGAGGPHGDDGRTTQGSNPGTLQAGRLTADRRRNPTRVLRWYETARDDCDGARLAKPDLIIADEPTTALDVIMQDRILGEIRDLQRELDSR